MSEIIVVESAIANPNLFLTVDEYLALLNNAALLFPTPIRLNFNLPPSQAATLPPPYSAANIGPSVSLRSTIDSPDEPFNIVLGVAVNITALEATTFNVVAFNITEPSVVTVDNSLNTEIEIEEDNGSVNVDVNNSSDTGETESLEESSPEESISIIEEDITFEEDNSSVDIGVEDGNDTEEDNLEESIILEEDSLEESIIIEEDIITDVSTGNELTNGSGNPPLGSDFTSETTAETLFIPPTGIDQLDGILFGRRWSQETISYSFPDSLVTDYGADYERFDQHAVGFAQASPTLQEAVRQWLTDISNVASLSFTELGATNLVSNSLLSSSSKLEPDVTITPTLALQDGDATIRVATSSDPDPAYAYLPFPSDEAGDAWFNNDVYGPLFSSAQVGNYAWLTIGHELLHSLGLKHGHEEGGVAGTALPSEWDSMEFSIMTYRSYEDQVLRESYTNANGHYAQSLMQLDILALQTLYGANFEVQADDTVYVFSSETGELWINDQLQSIPDENIVFRTIWDGNGQDTYNFSDYNTPLSIDLSPGGISDFDVGGTHQRANLGAFEILSSPSSDTILEPIEARGHLFNAFLFNDDPRSLIENTIGGTASDFLLGNLMANQLDGGAGNDVLDGREGNDILIDGAGNDQLTGGLDADHFILVADGQVDTITDFDNTSDMIDISNWAIADINQLTFSGTPNNTQIQFQQEILHIEGIDSTLFDLSKLIGFAPLSTHDISPPPFSAIPLPTTPLPTHSPISHTADTPLT